MKLRKYIIFMNAKGNCVTILADVMLEEKDGSLRFLRENQEIALITKSHGWILEDQVNFQKDVLGKTGFNESIEPK